jgi:hypothetical protein
MQTVIFISGNGLPVIRVLPGTVAITPEMVRRALEDS